MANRVYALSDLHGHYYILLEMLKKIHFDKTDKLYILGDCNDRGSKSLEIYDYLQEHTDNITLLKGNHELMMRDVMIRDTWDCPDGRLWSHNGGKKTMGLIMDRCKDDTSEEETEKNRKAYYKKMIEYINSCPNFVELTLNDTNFVLIHSGINPEKSLYDQDEEECCWMREWFYMSPGLKDKIIIFGHTPTNHIHGSSKCFDIWKDPIYNDKIGIDGGLGSFEEGQLNCLCLNDMSVTVLKKKDVAGEEI